MKNGKTGITDKFSLLVVKILVQFKVRIGGLIAVIKPGINLHLAFNRTLLFFTVFYHLSKCSSPLLGHQSNIKFYSRVV